VTPVLGLDIGPDGQVYTCNLAQSAPTEQIWQKHAHPAGGPLRSRRVDVGDEVHRDVRRRAPDCAGRHAVGGPRGTGCGGGEFGRAGLSHRADPAGAGGSREEIAKTRELSHRPFGVNLTILPTINPPPYDEYRRVIVDAGIKIVETAGSNKAPHLPMFHDNGIKVLHKCTSGCAAANPQARSRAPR
jgi:hypothetical protein